MGLPRILIVEDEEETARVLSNLLQHEGYEPSVAFTGAEGLQVAQTLLPDMVLMDIMLPGMDGYEVLQHIRIDERTRRIPVILVSALTQEENRLIGFQLGADDYLLKPFTKSELLQRMRALLSGGRRNLQSRPLEAGTRPAEPPTSVPRLAGLVAGIVGGAFHDLKNSLQATRGILELMEPTTGASNRCAGDSADLDLGDLIGRALRSMTRVQETVQLVHRFVRLFYRDGEGGEDIVPPEEIGSWLQHYLRPQVADRTVRFRVSVRKLPADLRIPAVLLRVLTSPLVTNAVEAGRAGVPMRIHLSLEGLADRPGVRIRVRDNGPGWPAPVAQIMADLGGRASYSSKGPGRGHGLQSIFWIVSRLEGMLRLSPGRRSGAVVEVVLPWSP